MIFPQQRKTRWKHVSKPLPSAARTGGTLVCASAGTFGPVLCVCVCLDAFGSLLDEAGCLFERAFVITCVLRLLERVEEQDLGIYSTGH